jgi:hypothetical protein
MHFLAMDRNLGGAGEAELHFVPADFKDRDGDRTPDDDLLPFHSR